MCLKMNYNHFVLLSGNTVSGNLSELGGSDPSSPSPDKTGLCLGMRLIRGRVPLMVGFSLWPICDMFIPL